MDKIEELKLAFAACPEEATATEARTVVVAKNNQLLRKSHFHRLAIAFAALEVSRREFPNLLADTLFEFKGELLWPNGTRFELYDEIIEEAFQHDELFRWLSDFKRCAVLEMRQRPQERMIPRLRLIDLYFRIVYPKRAVLIAK